MYPEENFEAEVKRRKALKKNEEELRVLTNEKMKATGLTRQEARREVIKERKRAAGRSKAKRLTAFGETKTFSEWVKDERCPYKKPGTLYSRVRKGWSPERAITQPSKTFSRRPK